MGNAPSSSGEKEDPWLTPDRKSIPGCFSGEFGEFWGFRDSLLLGEDRPREAVGGGGVDELQHLLVAILGIHKNRQDRPENLLGAQRTTQTVRIGPKKTSQTVRIGPKNNKIHEDQAQNLLGAQRTPQTLRISPKNHTPREDWPKKQHKP